MYVVKYELVGSRSLKSPHVVRLVLAIVAVVASVSESGKGCVREGWKDICRIFLVSNSFRCKYPRDLGEYR